MYLTLFRLGAAARLAAYFETLLIKDPTYQVGKGCSYKGMLHVCPPSRPSTIGYRYVGWRGKLDSGIEPRCSYMVHT